MKTLLTSVFFLTSVAFADEISIPNNLSNGQVADASDVQANFDVLAVESNENDGRITLNEQSIGTLQIQIFGESYSWLGYSEATFGPLSANYFPNGANLSNFCKSEFGVSNASVASLAMLEQLVRAQSLAPPPTGMSVLVQFSNDFSVGASTGSTSTVTGFGVNSFWGTTSNGDYCLMHTRQASGQFSEVQCSMNPTNGSSYRVACVKKN